jgi:hypothetical protein
MGEKQDLGSATSSSEPLTPPGLSLAGGPSSLLGIVRRWNEDSGHPGSQGLNKMEENIGRGGCRMGEGQNSRVGRRRES